MKLELPLIDRGELDQKRFVVVVHDVCPVFKQEILALVHALRPLIGRQMAAAVVPNWHGQAIKGTHFRETVLSHFDEILLHGWTHLREWGGGLISLVTQRSNEFAGLNSDEACRRLNLGLNHLRCLFDRPITGFVPPAWQRGPIDSDLLQRADLDFLMGYRKMEWADGYSVQLSTLTWDVGRFAALGVAAEWAGRMNHHWYPTSLPCLAIHPIDVTRGYLPRIARILKRWLAEGRIAVLPSHVRPPLAKEAVA